MAMEQSVFILYRTYLLFVYIFIEDVWIGFKKLIVLYHRLKYDINYKSKI